MTSRTDIAIIGAGPYGLSIGAHLNAAGRDLRVFGVPMQAWSKHTPAGMLLRSDPACSSLSDPAGSLTLAAFCRENDIPYEGHYLPVRRDDFIRYGQEFQRRFVPQAEARRVVALETHGGAYHLQFDQGEDVLANRVVVATGYLPFRYVPAALRELPPALASHSSDYGPLGQLKDRHVAILGAGSSALDLAGLLSRQGSRVTLVARAPRLQTVQPSAFIGSGAAPARAPRRSPAGTRGMGEGWLMRLCADAPQLIHHLPDSLRLALLEGTQNPPGSGLADSPIDHRVVIKLSRPVVRARELGGRLQLEILSADGSREQLDCDHIIAATGYRVDLRRLDFISEGLLDELRMLDHSPVLSGNFESSSAGLFFAGLPAARTFGPALRFIQGAVHPARRILEQLTPSSRRGHGASARAAGQPGRTAA